MFLNSMMKTLKTAARSDVARNFALGASFGGGSVAGILAVDYAIENAVPAAKAVGRGVQNGYETVAGWFSSDEKTRTKSRRRTKAKKHAKARRAKKPADTAAVPTRKQKVAVKRAA